MLIKSFFLTNSLGYVHDLSYVLTEIETTMRRKALRFLQITAEHPDCPVFNVFLISSSQKYLDDAVMDFA